MADLVNVHQPTAPVWDGNPENLPPMGQEFVYNGITYTWHPCNCRPTCQRPTAVRLNGSEDEGMTTRLRGTDQGSPIDNVLCKLGKLEELVATQNSQDPGVHLFITTVMAICEENGNDTDKVHAFLQGKGISDQEISIALDLAEDLTLTKLDAILSQL